MVDHFSLLAPIYERLIPPPDPADLSALLDLTPDCELLDAAGGTGRVSATFATAIRRTVVCDTSASMLQEAQRKGLETVQSEVESLPFADATFDRVLLVDAFHHLRDQRQALGELMRVLRPAGRLVIEEPDIRRPLVKLAAFLEKACLMRSNFVGPEEMAAQVANLHAHASIALRDLLRVWLVVTKTVDPVQAGDGTP